MRQKTFGGANGRIPQICARLDKCSVFADIGCDHGYCTRYMLDNGLCDRAIVTDISQKSLNKAAKLLNEEVRKGKIECVCCDGLDKVRGADLVLIAGMGGEEIVGILKRGYIPERFVFQPMKNAGLLRRYLVENGCRIIEDTLFRSGKFYFIIKGEREGGTYEYSDAEYAFGRDSINEVLFQTYIDLELSKISGYLQSGMSSESRSELLRRQEFLRSVQRHETH